MRIAAVIILATTVGLPFAFDQPNKAPGEAGGSVAVLQLEESALLFFILVALAAFVFSMWEGRLPSKTGHGEIEYEKMTKMETEGLAELSDKLQTEIETLRAQVRFVTYRSDQIPRLERQIDQLKIGFDELERDVEDLGRVVAGLEEDERGRE